MTPNTDDFRARLEGMRQLLDDIRETIEGMLEDLPPIPTRNAAESAELFGMTMAEYREKFGLELDAHGNPMTPDGQGEEPDSPTFADLYAQTIPAGAPFVPPISEDECGITFDDSDEAEAERLRAERADYVLAEAAEAERLAALADEPYAPNFVLAEGPGVLVEPEEEDEPILPWSWENRAAYNNWDNAPVILRAIPRWEDKVDAIYDQLEHRTAYQPSTLIRMIRSRFWKYRISNLDLDEAKAICRYLVKDDWAKKLDGEGFVAVTKRLVK